MKMEEVIALQKEALRPKLRKLFQNFPKDDFVMIRTYELGTTIIEEGMPSVMVYLLLSGSVETFWDQPGYSQYFAVHSEPLTFLGDLAPLCGHDYATASLRTLEKSTFLIMSRTIFLNWLDRDFELYKELAARNLKMLALQSRNSRSGVVLPNSIRILEYLHWFYEKGFSETNSEIIVNRNREQIVEDIGGISLRTLNRYLSQMEEQKLFTIVKGKIHISQSQATKIRQILSKAKEF